MANSNLRVTALINTYNYGRYVSFAINSVLQQTYKNIEIIVVDDGSTDHTQDILAQYGSRIRVARAINGGQGHAFNVGIPLAQGELIMLLDADDVWLPRKVERMVELAAEKPNAVMFYHRFVNVDDKEVPLDEPSPGTLLNGDQRTSYLRSGGSYWAPITSVLAFRAEHLRRLVPIPTYAVREGADTVITDCSLLLGDVASIPEVLTHRRLHGSNLYAAGREGHLRPQAVRESDVRRVEWRMHCNREIMHRLGLPFEIDIERNEWRTMNLYWLGRASLWQVIRACVLCQDHKRILDRLQRVKWAMQLKKFAALTQ
jgi:glycosyltransferase involved in cell wall biosynthesis